MFCKKDILKNVVVITEKLVYRGLFLNKMEGLKPAYMKSPTQILVYDFC